MADPVGRVEVSCLLAVELLETCCTRMARLSNRMTYDLALIFLLLRFRRRTRFFLHLALILNVSYEAGLAMMSTGDGGELRRSTAREQLESSKRRGGY